MKKRIASFVTLLLCLSLLTAFPVAHAEEIDPDFLPEEAIQQETVALEENLIPAVHAPQLEEVND